MQCPKCGANAYHYICHNDLCNYVWTTGQQSEEELEAFKTETLAAISRSYITNCAFIGRDEDSYFIRASHPLEIRLNKYHVVPSENYLAMQSENEALRAEIKVLRDYEKQEAEDENHGND